MRPDGPAAIQQQNAAAQLVQLLDLDPLPRLRAGLVLRTRGEPAHRQRGDLEGDESNPVLRIRHRPGEHWWDKEIVEAIHRDQGGNAGFPETPDHRNHHHDQEVEGPRRREVQVQPQRKERHQRDRRQSGQASAQNPQSRSYGLPISHPAIGPGPGVLSGNRAGHEFSLHIRACCRLATTFTLHYALWGKVRRHIPTRHSRRYPVRSYALSPEPSTLTLILRHWPPRPSSRGTKPMVY